MRTFHRGHRKPFPQPRLRMVAAAVAAACSCRRRESVYRHVEESPGLRHRTIGSSTADPPLYHNHHTSIVASALSSQSRGCGFESQAPLFLPLIYLFCTPHSQSLGLGPILLLPLPCAQSALYLSTAGLCSPCSSRFSPFRFFLFCFSLNFQCMHIYSKCHHFKMLITKYPCILIKHVIYVKCSEFYPLS